MMSLTGSTRTGAAVKRGSAETVKRGTLHCFNDTGQSCNAPTRRPVERPVHDDAVRVARETAESPRPTFPARREAISAPWSRMCHSTRYRTQAGPESTRARLVAGSPGRPERFNRSYFVRPTVFADVNSDMRIAREEIFGPMLSIIPFDAEEEAIAISDDTSCGLTNYVGSGDNERVRHASRRLRARMAEAIGIVRAPGGPFGGHKPSGNGRRRPYAHVREPRTANGSVALTP